jgi:hypothetical protein
MYQELKVEWEKTWGERVSEVTKSIPGLGAVEVGEVGCVSSVVSDIMRIETQNF